MDYIYNRELSPSGYYDVDNPYHVNEFGLPIRLESEIGAAFPSNPCNIVCNNTGVILEFESSLTSGEKNSLDALITTHKNDTLDDIRNVAVNWENIYGDYKRARDVIKVKAAISGFSNLPEVDKKIASIWFAVSVNNRNAVHTVSEQIKYGKDFNNNSVNARKKRFSYLVSQCYNRLTLQQTNELITEAHVMVDDYINYGKEGTLEGNGDGFFDYVLARTGSCYSGSGIATKNWTPSGMNNMADFADKLMNILKSGDYST